MSSSRSLSLLMYLVHYEHVCLVCVPLRLTCWGMRRALCFACVPRFELNLFRLLPFMLRRLVQRPLHQWMQRLSLVRC